MNLYLVDTQMRSFFPIAITKLQKNTQIMKTENAPAERTEPETGSPGVSGDRPGRKVKPRKRVRIETEITLRVDPVDVFETAAALQMFLPTIIDTFRPASDPEKVEALSEAMHNVVDEMAARSLEKLRLSEVMNRAFPDVEVL